MRHIEIERCTKKEKCMGTDARRHSWRHRFRDPYTDGPIIEGEEEQKSKATLLKRTGITQFAQNFSDILFMVIEMELPREFPKF